VANRKAISLRVSGTSPAAGVRIVLGRGGDGEESQREHGQGDPPVPGGPGTDLVLVEPGQAFAGLEVLLRGPPPAGNAHECGQRDVAG
jgi:hypothetical protein